MKNRVNVGFATLLLTASPSLLANNVYVGAKSGWVHGINACENHSLSCDSDELGVGIFAGYNIKNWLAIEAGYNYLGNIKANYPAWGGGSTPAPYVGKVQGVELGVKPYWDLNNRVSLFTNIGTFSWWTDVTGDEVGYQYSTSDHGWSPMLGAGLDMTMTNYLLARLEYQWFHNVGGDRTGGSSLNMLSASVIYRFGAARTVSVPVSGPSPALRLMP